MSEKIVLYELAAADTTRFSPFSWRSRWSLAHMGLPFVSVAVPFPDIAEIGGSQRTVPVIRDGDVLVEDSWNIATYLDEQYPNRPPLLGCELGKGATRFVERFTDKVMHPTILKLLAEDVFHRMTPRDQDYFRRTREEMLGMTLEEAQSTREQTVLGFRRAIHPIRLTLLKQPWLGGEAPGHADYIVMAALQWARLGSDFQVLEDDDPIAEWFKRGLDLHDGFGHKTHPDHGGPGLEGARDWQGPLSAAEQQRLTWYQS